MAIFETVMLIGLPSALEDLQIAGLAIMPVRAMVVDKRRAREPYAAARDSRA